MGFIIIFILATLISAIFCYSDTDSVSVSAICGLGLGVIITFASFMMTAVMFEITEKTVERPVQYEEVTIVNNVAVVVFDIDGEKITKSIDTDEVPTSFGDDKTVVFTYDEPRVDNVFGEWFWIDENPKATDKKLVDEGEAEKIVIDKSVIE